MALLTREAVLAADDLPKELVAVPEWGGELYIRTMTGEERDAYETSILPPGGKGAADTRNVRAKLVARTAVDAAGLRLFTDADIEALGRKSAAALDRCADVAGRLNGMSKADVESLAKNS